MNNFKHGSQIITARILSDPVFKQALLDSAGSPICDPRSRCTRQRLRQQGKCVYNESCCLGRHGSHSPRVSHVGRCLPDWPRDCCIMTWNFSCLAAMATSPCSDKVHCICVTSWSFFKERRRIKLHDRQLGGLY